MYIHVCVYVCVLYSVSYQLTHQNVVIVSENFPKVVLVNGVIVRKERCT